MLKPHKKKPLNKDYREIAKELRLENRHLKRELRTLREDFSSVMNSKSWQLTSPLRRFFRIIKVLRSAIRWKEFRFRPLPRKHLKNREDFLVPDGMVPWLELVPNGAYPRSGWAKLSLSLKSKQRYLTFYLIPSMKRGLWESSLRSIVPVESGRNNEILIKLPEALKGLRLEFYNVDEGVAFERVAIREIGGLQILLQQITSKLLPILLNPRAIPIKLKTLVLLFRQGGFIAIRQKLSPRHDFADYANWVKKFDSISDKNIAQFKKDINGFAYNPLISVIIPTFNTPAVWLKKAIDSVIGQVYENWELCIVDDASTDMSVRTVLEKYASDTRIRTSFRQVNGHISKTSNDAIEMAKGDFIAILDHDDELRPHSLYEVVKALQKNPNAKLIYSDEDKITTKGQRTNPYFKPDLNIELLRSQNYICHFAVLNTALVKKIGGFRSEVDGAQDWDLFLRVIDSIPAKEVIHIPKILYHWRIIESSTANSTAAKPYVLKAQQHAVQEHLARNGLKGKAEILYEISQIKVKYEIGKNSEALVSIIIPSKDQLHHLKRCINSIEEKTLHGNYEIIIVNNNSENDDTFKYFDQISKKDNIKIIDDSRPFNFSQLNNSAVDKSRGDYLLFLNNDIEIITKGWLIEMLSLFQQKDIGAVGARLLFPNDLLQHGGVILGIGGVAGHSHKGVKREDPGYFNRAILRSDFSAVTAACMLCRRDVFKSVGGFKESCLSVAFNDVDLCLRIGKAGYRIVYTPYAELYHYESLSRGYENTPSKFRRFEKETSYMKENWLELLNNDPCYNPNLTLLSEDFSLAYPPRQQD